MPMPPPKSSTEGRRDRQAHHEMGQIVRALEAEGPCTETDLRARVGGGYWEEGRFDRALHLAVTDGMVERSPEGTIAAV
jgi:hypothetical protein